MGASMQFSTEVLLSQELIADGVLCVIDMLEMYPAIVSDTESQRYATIVDTLRKASERAEEHWKSGDQGNVQPAP